MKFLIYTLLCFSLFSCNSSDDDAQVVCTEEFVYGLSVQVRDATTNGIIVNNITVTAKEGSYTEELKFLFDTFLGAGERAGNYTLMVVADGYENFTSEVITVSEDECHVIGESVSIRLQPN